MKIIINLLVVMLSTNACSAVDSVPSVKGQVVEYALPWPGDASGSTHELLFDINDKQFAWVTGQNFDSLGKVTLATGKTDVFSMPKDSGPHGMTYDDSGNLWVSLEFLGQVVRVSDAGEILEEIDVRMHIDGSPTPINTYPHAIATDADGETIWFTGKKTSTVGKINPDKSVQHFELRSLGATPIYLLAGPDGNMWGTELIGNKIFRVDKTGKVTEFCIPTGNSRPIAVVPGPDGKSIWFSEEAGHKVGRIDMAGRITEFPVPKTQDNMILASLTFDAEGNLWTQSYVNQKNPYPAGPDYIVRLDKSILNEEPDGISDIDIRFYEVPSRNAVFHRIQESADSDIWFTELKTDKLGKINLN